MATQPQKKEKKSIKAAYHTTFTAAAQQQAAYVKAAAEQYKRAHPSADVVDLQVCVCARVCVCVCVYCVFVCCVGLALLARHMFTCACSSTFLGPWVTWGGERKKKKKK
jgi:hypothetical protein